MTLCASCEKIPDWTTTSLLGGDPLSAEVTIFLKEQRIDVAFDQHVDLVCSRCGAEYRLEIEVEPMVWDFGLRRLKGGNATP